MAQDDSHIGRVLKQTYTLVKKIGEGGMGDVYKAIQSPLDREVAIKLFKSSESNPEGEHYFLREVRAINMLRHPNIISILDTGKEDDGTLYLVMEYLPGQTLKRMIRKAFPLPLRQVCQICIQILSALEQAHLSGVIHCDLKPANIMIERVAGQKDFVKVLDFGVAKIKGPALEVGPYTQEGNIVGTFDYMSPEQIMRKELDGRSDVWSMGVILFEMLTQKRLFHDKDAVSIIGRVMQMEIPTLSETLGEEVPEPLERILSKALTRQASRRYQSADAMRRALHDLMEGTSSSYPRPFPVMAKPAEEIPAADEGISEHRPVSGATSSSSSPLSLVSRGTSVLDQTLSIDALKASLKGERRKVAVLSIQQRAQRSQSEDPSILVARSRQEARVIREVVEKFSGVIDSFVGGTYVVLFGAKHARVGDNLRAIRCAREMQSRFALLEQGCAHLGMGLCYGEVFLSSKKGGSAYGEAIDRSVAIARATRESRLFVDHTLVDLTRLQVEYDAPRTIASDSAHEIISLAKGGEVFSDEDAPDLDLQIYVPRPGYVEELVRRAASVENGQGGGVALVASEGVGKTVMLERFCAMKREQGWHVFALSRQDLGRGERLACARAWIRQVASTYADPQVLIEKACASLGLSEGIDAVVTLFSQEHHGVDSRDLPFRDEASRLYFTAALFHKMIRFAIRQGPVLFALDGLDPSERTEMAFFDALLSSIQHLPVMVVGSVRLETGVRDHDLPGGFEVLYLHGFTPEESRQFISRILGFMPHEEIVTHLHERASGNPMYMREMVRSLILRGGTQLLMQDVSVLKTETPLTLQELLAEKLDALEPRLREVMAIASVLGESFQEAFFYQVVPHHMGPRLMLEELVGLGMLELRTGDLGQARIGFEPRAMRGVVYDRIPPQVCRDIHASIIEFLESSPHEAAVEGIDIPLMLSMHYKSVGSVEGAAHYLIEASKLTREVYDYSSSADQLRDALDFLAQTHPPHHDMVLGAKLSLLTVLRESGRVEEAQEVIDSLPPLDDIRERWRMALRLEAGLVSLDTGSLGASTEALSRVVDRASAEGLHKIEVRALLALGQVFEKEGQIQRAITILVEVLEKVEAIGELDPHDPDDRKLHWAAYNQLGTLCIRRGLFEQALEYLSEGLARASAIEDHRGVLRITSNIGALFFSVRDLPNARAHFAEALALAVASGDLLNQARISMNIGRVAIESNDVDGAKEHLRQARSLAEEIGWYEGLAELRGVLRRLREMM